MRVLTGFIMDGKSGGIDKYLLNVLEQVSSVNEQITMDFLTNEIDQELQTKLASYGSSIYAIPNLKHPIGQYRTVREILEKGQYDAVYFNISTAIDLIAAKAAKDAGVKQRMIHSHSSGNDCESNGKRFVFDSVHGICKNFLYRYGNEFYGCSVKAGEWLFPRKVVESKDFQVIHNAVDRKKFSYDPKRRELIRAQLLGDNRKKMKSVQGELQEPTQNTLEKNDEKIEQSAFEKNTKYVYGHVGNFCYQKNHYFLLEIFKEIHKRQPEAELWLVGDGVRFDEVKRRVHEMELDGCVKLLGRRSDADILYQGMDAFLLPSNFEGLPIAGIEAQSAGLPCFMSDSITKESKITEDCYFLPLKESASYWVEEILKHKKARETAHFLDIADVYDLQRQTEEIRELFARQEI